jgi:hypothetical protein
MAYASLTGTRSTIASMRAHGWGVLVTPDTWKRCRVPRDIPLACDNGAWGAFNGKRAWDAHLFVRMMNAVGRDVAWVVVPDVVGNAVASLALTRAWLPWCLDNCAKVLVAVQDGMAEEDVAPMLGPRVGVFVGGSTEWKLRTLRAWVRLAARLGAYSHVGRVNSAKRIAACADAGADSADGNSVVMFPCTMPRLDRAMKRTSLQFDMWGAS